ncbi:hypothetical protein Btru_068337 [Bulinus truncatus]|nr:hypothetical protein Btru_068337 [Bulinus truncatus]
MKQHYETGLQYALPIPRAPTVNLISQTPIALGGSFSLLCSSNYQAPGIVYTWYRNNTAIVGAISQTYNRSNLIISDAGAYKCSFISGSDNSLESSNFIVVYNSPPRPTLSVLGTFDSKRGSMLTLQCTVGQSTSYDLILSKLYKDGAMIANVTVSSVVVNFTEVALLRTSGNYACTFTNKVGESLQSQAYTVQVTNIYPRTYDAKPHIPRTRYLTALYSWKVKYPSVEPASPAPPVQNQFYTLQCVVEPHNGSIQWYKNYDSTRPIGLNASTLDVFISSTEMRNMYQCVLTVLVFQIPSLYYTVSSSVPATPALQIKEENTILRDKNVSLLLCSSSESGETFSLYRDGIRVFEKPGNGTVVFTIKIGKHGAFYTCTTTNGYGESKHSNSMYLPGLNQLYISASSPLQSLGQSLNLSCSMKNPPLDVAYTWNIYRVNGSTQTLNSPVLTIPTLRQDDYGMYSCQITLNGQIIRADNYYLITFAVPPAPDITVSVSTTAPTGTLQCFIQSLFIDVKKTFKLYSNGFQVRNLPYIDVLKFDKVFNLWRYYTIDTSLQTNIGNYFCKAQNFIGESNSSKSVSVSFSSGFTKPSVSPSLSQPSVGSSIIMSCITNGITGANLQIAWQKDFVSMMEASPTLTLNALGVEDDGFYACTVDYTNAQGVKLRLISDAFYLPIGQPLQPSLLFDPSYTDFAKDDYDIGNGPMFYIFGQGESVHVVCFSQVPHIIDKVWKTTSNIKTSYTYNLYNNRSERVDQSTDGAFAVSSLPIGNHSYTCQAQSASSSSVMSYPLIIQVTLRPNIIMSSIDSMSKKLLCNTTRASKGFDIIWKKNGVFLKEKSQTLNLYSFSAADEGKYSCRQQMGPWYLASSEDFNVTYGTKAASPDIVADDLSERGSQGVIDCITNSTTSFQAVFYKNGKPVYTASDVFFDNGGHAVFMYTIPSISANDSGRYTCTVQNSLGVSDESSPLDAVYVGQCSNSPCEQVCQENAPGTSYNCSCQLGYSINNDQLTCQACDDSHFGPSCASSCTCVTQNSKCDKTNGSCICNAGWQGPTCAFDMDECSSGQHNCIGAESCINTVGSFQCNCSAGYTSLGSACQDVNECERNPCKLNETCVNNNGSFTCPCKDGYQPSVPGGNCVDIDECVVSKPCTQVCTNTVGGHVCGCNTGYLMDENGKCVYINECLQNPCKLNETCVNNNGSFTCPCKDGYQPSVPGGNCVVGGHVCGCNAGYLKDENGKCVSLYIRSFDIHYPSVSPSSNVLTQYTSENNVTVREINTTVYRQMKLHAKGFLDLEVNNLRQGSLVALVGVYLNRDNFTNLGGYLAYALTRMNMSELTISGTRQPDAYITVGTFRVRYDTPQCELRAIIDACLCSEKCLEDVEGVSFCQSYAALVFNENMYDYLGLGIGVGFIAGVALTITVFVIVCNYPSKSRKLKKKQDSIEKKSSSPQTSQPTSPWNYTDAEGYSHFIKRANLRGFSDYRSEI